jgi:hypothetical protein
MKKYAFNLLIIVLVAGLLIFTRVNAAGLTNITVAPTSQAQSTLTNVVVTFTPNTAITNSSILSYSYDPLFTGGAALTNSDITITGTNITSKVCSNFVAGYFNCTLTTSANVTTTVTTTIGNTNQLTTPSSAGNYSFSVTADIGGLGTTIDSGAGLAYISNNAVKENEVQITAYVPPNLSLELYQSGTNTELVDPNNCGLGVLTINGVKTCTYDLGVGTNNATGASVTVASDGKLRNGATNFTDTVGTVTAGSERYGFYISTQGSRFTAAGSYGTAYQAVPQPATSFASSTQTSDLLNTAHHMTITHAASISSLTEVGNYAHKLTYRAFTN